MVTAQAWLRLQQLSVEVMTRDAQNRIRVKEYCVILRLIGYRA